MSTRGWILTALAGVLVAAPACALVLGAEELPQGTGGAGTPGAGSGTTSSRASSGATTSSASSSSSTGAHTSASSTSSSTTSSASSSGVCATETTCASCMLCMGMGACNAFGSACASDPTCKGYLACVLQCPEDASFTSCAVGNMGCNGTPVTDQSYVDLKSCACAECKGLCPYLCQ